MNCNTTHYRANSSSVPGDPTTRFGVVVSERSAASALPVLGAVGGATVNMLFMNHFQRVAHGHFVIRRFERQYGAAVVRKLYAAHAPQRAAQRVTRRRITDGRKS